MTTATSSMPGRVAGHDPHEQEQEQPHAGQHDGHGAAQADELAGDERGAAHRLGEEHEDGALLDLLVHEARGDEHGDDEPEEGDRDEPEVLHHPALLAEADAAEPEAAGDHDEGEDDDDREHAVADRLLERVGGDGEDLVHAVTTCMKKSSSVGASASASSTVPGPGDATLAHDGDARAELVHVAEDVRVEEHRLAALVQVLDDALDLDAADRVEPGHRLVEQHELGVVDERLGDADALQHALGVLAQVRVGGALQTDVPEQGLDALAPAARVEAEQPRAEPEELAAGEVVVEVRVLRQVARRARRPGRPARPSPTSGA